MSQAQILTAAMDGLGTTKSSGANLADSNLLTVLGLTAFPAGFNGNLDITIVSGTVYIENNGTAADNTKTPFAAGDRWSIRNCNSMAAKLHFFAAAAYDMRIALYSGGTP